MVWRWHEKLTNVASDQKLDQGAGEWTAATRALRRKTHQTIARISRDFDDLHFNTNVAALMELLNELSDFNSNPAAATGEDVFAVREALEALVVMLTPFAPHAAEEMWEALGHEGGLLTSARWPQADPELARSEELEIPVQTQWTSFVRA